MRELLIKGQKAFLPEEQESYYENELARCRKWVEDTDNLVALVRDELKMNFSASMLYQVLTGQSVLTSNEKPIDNVKDFIQYLNEQEILKSYPSKGSLRLDMEQALSIFKLDISEALIQSAHQVFTNRTIELFGLIDQKIVFTGIDLVSVKYCFVLNEVQMKAYDSLLVACEHLKESFDKMFGSSWPPIAYLSSLFTYEGTNQELTFSPSMRGIERMSELF